MPTKEYIHRIHIGVGTETVSDLGERVELIGLNVFNPNTHDVFFKLFGIRSSDYTNGAPSPNQVAIGKTFRIGAGKMIAIYNGDTPIWETEVSMWMCATRYADDVDATGFEQDLVGDFVVVTHAPFPPMV